MNDREYFFYTSLQCKVKDLERQIKGFRSGEKYVSLREEYKEAYDLARHAFRFYEWKCQRKQQAGSYTCSTDERRGDVLREGA